MRSTFNSEKIAIGEGIYSRPQSRVITAYELWLQHNPNGTPSQFLSNSCQYSGRDGVSISKWQCQDEQGTYLVKLTTWL